MGFHAQFPGSWRQQAKLVGTGAVGAAAPLLGTSVGLSADGNTAVAGGPGDDATPDGLATGAAWVFRRGAGGVWSQYGSKLVGAGAVRAIDTFINAMAASQ